MTVHQIRPRDILRQRLIRGAGNNRDWARSFLVEQTATDMVASLTDAQVNEALARDCKITVPAGHPLTNHHPKGTDQ